MLVSAMFHLVASTGRTATSFIAQFLNELPDVVACHEGHLGNDAGPDVLPLINLENNKCFASRDYAHDLVTRKRSRDVIEESLRKFPGRHLVDVAYYNSMILEAALELHADSKAVCLIRDCESFVRSATWITGEDPMPVGWPDPGKELSPREKFISMGRIRPYSEPEKSEWASWTTIERNIWLWRATNMRIIDAKISFPERIKIVDFEEVKSDAPSFFVGLIDFFDLGSVARTSSEFKAALNEADSAHNERHGGYQIGHRSSWSARECKMIEEAEASIRMQIEGHK